jgi:hypothetical protein
MIKYIPITKTLRIGFEADTTFNQRFGHYGAAILGTWDTDYRWENDNKLRHKRIRTWKLGLILFAFILAFGLERTEEIL